MQLTFASHKRDFFVFSSSICRQIGVDHAPAQTHLIRKAETQATRFPVPSIRAQVVSHLVPQERWQIKEEI